MADGLGDADGSAVRLGVGDGVGLADWCGPADIDGVGESLGPGESLGLGDGEGPAESLGLDQSVGLAEPLRLGDGEGLADPRELGESVGLGESLAPGDSDGLADSLGLGETVGLGEALAVGDSDGLGDGATVGVGVGRAGRLGAGEVGCRAAEGFWAAGAKHEVAELPPDVPEAPDAPDVADRVLAVLSRASVSCWSASSRALWSSLTVLAAPVLSTSASVCPASTVSPACTEMLVTVLETVKDRLRVWAGSTVPLVPTSVETAPRSAATVTRAFGFSDAPAVTACATL